MNLPEIIVVHDSSDGSTIMINLAYVTMITQESAAWRVHLHDKSTVPINKFFMDKIVSLIESRQKEPQA